LALFSAKRIIYSAEILEILAIGKIEIFCSRCIQFQTNESEGTENCSGKEKILYIHILPLRAIYIERFPKTTDSIRHHQGGSGRPPSTDGMHPASEEHGLGHLDLLRRSSALWLQSDARSGSFDLKVEIKGLNG